MVVEWDAQTILVFVCALGALIGLVLLMHFYIMPTFIWPMIDVTPIDWSNVTELEGSIMV